MNSREILRKDFEDLKDNPLCELAFTVELFNPDNIYEWKIISIGPKDTPYADGIFIIKLKFPQDYPNQRPSIFFLTRIFHMNVHLSDGYVCVNFINDWRKNSTVREILTKLYSVFYLINPNSPYNEEPFQTYKENKELYYLKAAYYTKKLAIFDSFEDFKSYYGKKNFSNSFGQKSEVKNNNLNNNENIKLYVNINGEPTKYCFIFNSNMRVIELIDRIKEMENINFYEELLIYEGRKLDKFLTLSENGLKNEGHITIIYGVHY